MAMEIDLDGLCCGICYISSDLRVLTCGHPFCIKCLEILYCLHGRKVSCPMDRMEDKRLLRNLPTPEQLEGTLIPIHYGDERFKHLDNLIDEGVQHRMHTIDTLRKLAAALRSNEFKAAVAQKGFIPVGVVGAVLAIVGFILSLSGVAAVVGVPLAIAGTSIAATGGATTGITIGVEAVLQKSGLSNLDEVLAKDYFKSQQIQVLLARAAADVDIARKWKINCADRASVQSFLRKMAKVGIVAAAGVTTSLGIGRAAVATGLDIAGLSFAVVLIPIDIVQTIVRSIEIHICLLSPIIEDIEHRAHSLAKGLRIYLIERGDFQMATTIDTSLGIDCNICRKLEDF